MRQAFLQVFKKRSNSVVKILLLGLGLAMGLVLIAKVYYERRYDNFMDDPQRVYVVLSDYSAADGIEDAYARTQGAIAPGIKAYSPAVEYATRTTAFVPDLALSLVDKNGLVGRDKFTPREIFLADTSFFDVFTRRIRGGDPRVSGGAQYKESCLYLGCLCP